MAETLTIDTLGAKGDGIARDSRGQNVFVPGALPGETVSAALHKGQASDVAIVSPSADRAAPPCPHYGVCGGCSVQHMSEALYRSWKRDLVADALKREGISADVEPLVACEPASRRRATFSAIRTKDGLHFGFQGAQSNHIFDLETCLVVTSPLLTAVPDLKALAELVLPKSKPVHMTVLDSMTGLDVAIEGDFKFDDKVRPELSAALHGTGIVRVAVNGEVIIEVKHPALAIGQTLLHPPAGAFAQAVAPIEQAMAELAASHMKKARRVADLFSGTGAFALRLSEQVTVHAVESDAAALKALDRAWGDAAAAKRLKPLTVEKRDLFRSPLTARDLNAYKGVVFDPPRAGAEAQTREIAASAIEKVAAVSCNPQTLARDLRILIDAGFTLERVVPFDQFLWSHHVEAVALLSRKGASKKEWRL